jgi:hypothetical protein
VSPFQYDDIASQYRWSTSAAAEAFGALVFTTAGFNQLTGLEQLAVGGLRRPQADLSDLNRITRVG